MFGAGELGQMDEMGEKWIVDGGEREDREDARSGKLPPLRDWWGEVQNASPLFSVSLRGWPCWAYRAISAAFYGT